MDERTIELVLRAAECVPPGRVTSYGAIARVTGTSARLVGRVMAVHGAFVPWWRVTNVRGALPAGITRRAEAHWDAEEIPHAAGRARIAEAGVDEHRLRAAWESATRDLRRPGEPG
ncbi:MGMT family protein [Brevibacterium ihuae]|uniref:MGMT family protein n=1 Tax=Brevibacterium ihuae TaxID=1631743 RepID=UPI000C7768B2|nr:MGMT family protein [Brevibacterium ihuae]